jgi:hypothetical protein
MAGVGAAFFRCNAANAGTGCAALNLPSVMVLKYGALKHRISKAESP